MRARTVVAAVVVAAAAAVCVRLGFWQIDRLHQKQALNRQLREALALPPFVVTGIAPRFVIDPPRPHRDLVAGTYDERHQVLLSARSHAGAPGVHVVTPMVLADGRSAVLIDRGWLSAPDAATALPQDHPEPGLRRVVGLAEPIGRGLGGPPLRVLEADSVTVWSAARLDLDSLAKRVPYSLASFSVRALPEAGAPAEPVREPPQPWDEMMHTSYAIQWFTFAAILLVGPLFLARSRRRAARREPFAVPPPPPLPR